uniref:Uncharacterized protein n=1 Tax=Lepeophtheirus salmonis TaxID=72036 RepID=A0A0K2U510_LEPSM
MDTSNTYLIDGEISLRIRTVPSIAWSLSEFELLHSYSSLLCISYFLS